MMLKEDKFKLCNKFYNQIMPFNLTLKYFNHESHIHGIMHTYRVMHNVQLVAREHEINEQQIKTAYCAAFIHDMARMHDGFCTEHGAWAVAEKLPLFKNDFIQYGLSAENIEALKTAVTYHSLHEELSSTHEHYEITALLKDADALDRIRLGYPGLDASYLRLPKSKLLIETAEHNFFITENSMCNSWFEFSEIIKAGSLKITELRVKGFRFLKFLIR